jgi:ribonuclease HI
MKIIQFDGGAVPNPGTRAIGVILLDDTHVLKEISRKLDGIGTNNEAEYSALIEGLKQVIALGWTEILVQGDRMERIFNELKICLHLRMRIHCLKESKRLMS